jgi:hypothetical protein
VVEIDGLRDSQVTWEVVKHPDYAQFASYLKEGEEHRQDWLSKVSSSENFEDLIFYQQLGGRGCAAKVQFRNGGAEYFVFKGIDFRTFLTQRDGQGDGLVKYLIKTWH